MPVTRTCKQCERSYQTVPCHRRLFCGAACYHASKVGSGNPKWRGGVIEVDGYLYQHAPTHPNTTRMGYVCQHRLVMETVLNRYLLATEVVHHINGDRKDNRPENLEVCASNGAHTIEHHAIRDFAGRFTSATKPMKPVWHGNRKLTDEQIKTIRKERNKDGMTLIAIAQRHQISTSTVYGIAAGISHRRVA